MVVIEYFKVSYVLIYIFWLEYQYIMIFYDVSVITPPRDLMDSHLRLNLLKNYTLYGSNSELWGALAYGLAI